MGHFLLPEMVPRGPSHLQKDKASSSRGRNQQCPGGLLTRRATTSTLLQSTSNKRLPAAPGGIPSPNSQGERINHLLSERRGHSYDQARPDLHTQMHEASRPTGWVGDGAQPAPISEQQSSARRTQGGRSSHCLQGCSEPPPRAQAVLPQRNTTAAALSPPPRGERR